MWMTIKENKKELLVLLIFVVTNLLFLSRGVIKYAVFSLFAVSILFFKKKLDFKQMIVFAHAIVYFVIGSVLALINKGVNYMCISQILIYFSAAFTAWNYYSLSDGKDTSKYLDLYFYGICIAYAILFILFNHEGSAYYSDVPYGGTQFQSTLFWETHVYGYILGLFVVLYFCQKRFLHLCLALVFMMLEHKRIVELAVIISVLLVLSFKILKKDENKEKLFIFYVVAFVIFSFVWIYMMSSDFLSNVLHLTDKLTSLRMSLWHSAVKHYSFNPLYIGKGIGWVKTWMSIEGIHNLDTLHNDFLVAYIELGFVGYLVWILSFVAVFFVSRKRIERKNKYVCLIAFFYMFLNFLTDNTYIYISFMLPFYLIVLSLIFGEDKIKYVQILKLEEKLEID